MKAIILISILLIVGCSSVQYVEKEVKVPVYITVTDTMLLKDTVIALDTLWYSDVVDSLNNTIGWLKVYYKKKLAQLNITKKDTVKFTQIDTIYVDKPKPIEVISGLLPAWAEIVLIAIGIGLLYLTTKTGKILK